MGFVLGSQRWAVFLGEYGERLPFIAAVNTGTDGCSDRYIDPEGNIATDEKAQKPFSIFRANPLGSIIQMSKDTALVLGFLTLPSSFIQLAAHRPKWQSGRSG